MFHLAGSARQASGARASSCSSWSASRARARARRLSAPVLRRHAPAGDDRDRAACEPKLLIADEPTTALDVTIQAQILDLLREARDALGMALILITHDLGVVAEIATA